MKKVKIFSWSQPLRPDGTLTELISDEINAFLVKLHDEVWVREEDISITINVTPSLIIATSTPLEHNSQTLRTHVVLVQALISWKEDRLVAL